MYLQPDEVDVLVRLVSREVGRTERRIEKESFTPEPGKRDANKYKVGKLHELLSKLEAIREEEP